MNNQIETKAKSVWGRISLACGIAGISLIISGVLGASALQTEKVFIESLFISLFLFGIGILSGTFGLVTRRTWIGLILNLFLGIFGYYFFQTYFIGCCAPPLMY